MSQLGPLLFLASMISVGIVIWWALKNDDAGDDGPTHGLFAMRDHRSAEEQAQSAAEHESAQAGPDRPWLHDNARKN